MAGAYTTLKLSPADHQAIRVLLGYLAGKVTEEGLRAVLITQGRRVPSEMPVENIVSFTAESLIFAVA